MWLKHSWNIVLKLQFEGVLKLFFFSKYLPEDSFSQDIFLKITNNAIFNDTKFITFNLININQDRIIRYHRFPIFLQPLYFALVYSKTLPRPTLNIQRNYKTYLLYYTGRILHLSICPDGNGDLIFKLVSPLPQSSS